MSRKKVIFLRILIPCLIVLALGVIAWNVLRMVSKSRVIAYEEIANEDGIVTDTDDNPYFAKKQPGYIYKSPDTITYHSDVTGTDRKAMVFLPAGYDENKKYPVLYLLHGYGGSHKTWRNKDAHIIMQNLYYFKDAEEMIVVCPDCVVGEDVEDDIAFWEAIPYFDLTNKELTGSLMPYIESHYPVKTGRDNTAIAGNSMGGRNALAIAFDNQDLFGYVGAFSSVSPMSGRIPGIIDELKIDEKYGQFNYLMLCVGREDEVCGEVSYMLDEYMTEKGIEHVFYDREGGHENTVWKNALYNFGQKIFK